MKHKHKLDHTKRNQKKAATKKGKDDAIANKKQVKNKALTVKLLVDRVAALEVMMEVI